MDECCGRPFGFVVRILIAFIVVSVVLNVFFGYVSFPFTYGNWFWNVIGIILILWVISWFFGPFGHRHGNMGWHEMWILRRRFARGEITEAQYKRAMKVLEEGYKERANNKRRRS
jgi:uncharacterized membrane protein